MTADSLSRSMQVLAEVRRFADEEIRPHAAAFDENQALPQALITKMAERKYLLASLPEECGGLGLGAVDYGHFTEQIGKACCSTRALITVQSSLVGETLFRWGSQQQKAKWLPRMAAAHTLGAFALTEPNAGTDARGIRTTYRTVGNEHIITGQKKWISYAEVAGFFIVIATCEGRISAFIVERDREGVKTVPMKNLLANRASHLAKIELNEVAIPRENVIGPLGSGFEYAVGTALDHGRYSIAWAAVAVAQEALEAMVTYSRKRSQFETKISKFQLIQGLIGDAVTKIHAARALCISAGKAREKGHPAAIQETTIAKYFASTVAADVTRDAVQVHGGNGCSNRYPVERLFREAKLFEIIEGTSQIQQQIIAKYGLRTYYRPQARYRPSDKQTEE